MNRPPSRVVFARRLSRLLGIAAIALAGCGAPQPAKAADDPAALLNAAADALYEGESAGLRLTTTVSISQGGEDKEMVAEYRFARSGPAKFVFRPLLDDDAAADDGVFVGGNGELILTHIPQLGRYTLEESAAGIVSFVRSPLSQGVGYPRGGLGLSLLHPDTTAEMAGRLSAAEAVGEEMIGETETQRCRYTVDDELTFDVWFTTGEKPRAVRLESDVSSMLRGGDPEAKFIVRFDYAAAEDPTDEELRLVAPAGAIHAESFFQRSGGNEPHRLLGETAPAFELAGLDGEPVNLAEHLGQDVVVLDFWATWCPPCVAALPAVDRITRSYADKGVVFYAVDQGESAEQVSTFLESKSISPPVLLDQEGAAASAYDVEGLPTSVLIGRDGTVQVVHVGFGPNLETLLTEELDALVAGQDLAAEKVRIRKEAEAKRREKLERLRAKLDGAS